MYFEFDDANQIRMSPPLPDGTPPDDFSEAIVMKRAVKKK